jgi:hypothetical protein
MAEKGGADTTRSWPGIGPPNRKGAHALLRGLTFLLSTSAIAVAADVGAFPANGVDLNAYKTYKILPPKVMTSSGIQEDEPTIGPLVREALRRGLTEKGLTEATGQPDLEIASLVTAVSVPQLEAIIYSWTYDGTSIAGTAPLATIGRYNREGTLYVNFIDSRKNKGVWLGISTRALGKPSSREKDINKAAGAMFKKYPALK